MTEPAAAIDGLIQRLREEAAYADASSAPMQVNPAVLREAADTLAAQAAQLAEVTAERDARVQDVGNAYLKGIKQGHKERDAQVREAFLACIRASCDECARGVEIDKDGGSKNWLHWEGKGSNACTAQHLWLFLARAGAVGSVGAEPKET